MRSGRSRETRHALLPPCLIVPLLMAFGPLLFVLPLPAMTLTPPYLDTVQVCIPLPACVTDLGAGLACTGPRGRGAGRLTGARWRCCVESAIATRPPAACPPAAPAGPKRRGRAAGQATGRQFECGRFERRPEPPCPRPALPENLPI